MAKRLAIPSKELGLKVVGPRDSFLATRVQRLNITNDIPNTQVDELGNNQHAGTVTDTPNVTLTFSAFDTSIKIFSTLTGTNAAAYPVAGVDIENLGEIDAILYVKDDTVADFVKSGHAKRLQIRDFAFNYTVDGESTEDYTAIGSEKRWFKNDVVVDKFTSGTTGFTLSQTPIQLKNGNYCLSVILDGAYLTEVAGAPATGEYRITAGTTLTTGDSRTAQVLAVYHADPVGNNWSYAQDATIPAAIRGNYVKVFVGGVEMPRVQSVVINGSLNPQPVKQLGSTSVVGYQRQVPTVNGSITVLDTDTELIAMLLTGSIAPADTEFEVGIGCVTSGVPLKVRMYDPCDAIAYTNCLKTVYIPELRIVGDTYSINVNGNASQVFNWMSETAECIVFSGSY